MATGKHELTKEHDDDHSDAVPVCPHCLTPVKPFDHYCRRCGEAVGKFTPYMPFINIRFACNFYKRIWIKVWHDKNAGIATKIFCFFFIILFVPVMLIGLPFIIRDKLGKK
ncbi:MAG: hypothetical protein PVJ60_10200 [Phycisphaerales bacterium]|jgi:hypothetical protein